MDYYYYVDFKKNQKISSLFLRIRLCSEVMLICHSTVNIKYMNSNYQVELMTL